MSQSDQFTLVCRYIAQRLNVKTEYVRYAVKQEYFGFKEVELGGKKYRITKQNPNPKEHDDNVLARFACLWAHKHYEMVINLGKTGERAP